MRESPGLQLADLVAYEFTHYYHLKRNHPHLRTRYPVLKLCEHLRALKSGGFKYVPGWKLKLKMTHSWGVVQDILWEDEEQWMPMLKQLGPAEMMTDERIRRIAFLRRHGTMEDYPARRIRRER
jgi:hypothetical protein